MTLLIHGGGHPKDGQPCVSFVIQEKSGVKNFRNVSDRSSIAIYILSSIKVHLDNKGYQVVGPRTGKVGEASMTCKSSVGKVAIMAIFSTMDSLEHWQLRTAYSASAKLNSADLSEREKQNWGAICLEIDLALKTILLAENIHWLSHEEAERQCTS